MDLVAHLKAAPKLTAGVIVEAPDGRIFFLPNAEAKKFQIKSSNLHRAFLHVAKLPPRAHTAKKARGCAGTLKWLLTHDPDSQFWRQVSVDWMNNC